MATFDILLNDEMRKKYSADYVLTEQEAKYIKKAELVFVDAAKKYISVDDAELHTPTVQAAMREDVFTAFKRKRLSASKILKIAERVRQGSYWSYELVGIEIPENETAAREIYRIECRINGETEREQEFDTFSLEAFFKSDSPRERAKLLNIPDDVLYLPSFELRALKLLWKICKEKEITKQDPSVYWLIKTSPVLDVLSEIGSEAVAGSEFVEGFSKSYKLKAANGVTITIDASAYNDVGQLLKTPNADKLMTQFNHKAVEQGFCSQTVELTLDEVMDARRLTDRKAAADAIRAATRLLYALSVNIEDRETGSFRMRRIVQAADYIAGKGRKPYATITYTDDYFKHLKNTQQIMQYHAKLQQIPNNKPHAYNFAKAFDTQKRRNAGKPEGIENKLSVLTLLKKSGLPRYDKLKDKGQASQRIIMPFITALDYLEEDIQLFTYEFQHPKRGNNSTELTDEELDKLYHDYSFFTGLMISVTWYDEPDYQHLVERKKEQIKKAEKARKRSQGK